MSTYLSEHRGGNAAMTVMTIRSRVGRWLPRLAALAASGGLLTAPARIEAQSVSGQGAAAVVSTPLTGSQQFASATLPSGGGMNNADLDVASVPNTFDAEGLTSIATGQIDETLVSATTTAEAAKVNILNGLIRADAVLAVATSYANGVAATSESNGSTLIGLVVNGVSYGDGSPAPNTRLNLPGVGYVLLNEQIPAGDGVTDTELTVNMIHVYLIAPLTGASLGDIVVGAARSAASL